MHLTIYSDLAASPSVLKAQLLMTVCILINLLADILIHSTQRVHCNEVKPGCTVFSDRSTDAVMSCSKQEFSPEAGD